MHRRLQLDLCPVPFCHGPTEPIGIHLMDQSRCQGRYRHKSGFLPPVGRLCNGRLLRAWLCVRSWEPDKEAEFLFNSTIQWRHAFNASNPNSVT